MSKIFHSTIVLAAFLALSSVSFAQEPRTDQPPSPRYAQENWSEYLDATPYLVPANPPGKAQIRPFIAPATRLYPCRGGISRGACRWPHVTLQISEARRGDSVTVRKSYYLNIAHCNGGVLL